LATFWIGQAKVARGNKDHVDYLKFRPESTRSNGFAAGDQQTERMHDIDKLMADSFELRLTRVQTRQLDQCLSCPGMSALQLPAQ
jgi:hypothetical protein